MSIGRDRLKNRLDELAKRPVAPGAEEAVRDERLAGDEQAIVEAAANRNGTDAAAVEDAPSGPPVPRLGREAARNMTELSQAAAADIRKLGELAFEAGKAVQAECEQMARDVETNGRTVAQHMTGLSQLLADVGISNRETFRRLIGGASLSMAPPVNNDHVAE